MVTDNGTVTYVTDDTDKSIDRSNLRGDSELVSEINNILDDPFTTSVPVAWSTYYFSINRTDLSDMVAAMYSIGYGRGMLNEEGWEILHKAMPELTDPENNRDDVIY